MADDFPYGFDVGVPSIAGVVALAHSSGVQFSVTSTFRDEAGSYHQTSNAVDMASSAGGMAELASYLYQYSAYLLELIHSGGGGYFVKKGRRVTANFYGDSIVADHYNHVHCAATMSGLQAAGGGTLVIPEASLADDSRKGCLTTTATTAVLTIGGLYWTLDLFLR